VGGGNRRFLPEFGAWGGGFGRRVSELSAKSLRPLNFLNSSEPNVDVGSRGGVRPYSHFRESRLLHHAQDPSVDRVDDFAVGASRLRFLLLQQLLQPVRIELSALDGAFVGGAILGRADGGLLRQLDGRNGCLRGGVLSAEQPGEGVAEGIVSEQSADVEGVVCGGMRDRLRRESVRGVSGVRAIRSARASLRMQREMQGASAAVECEDSEVATFVEVLLEAEVEQSVEEETIVRLSDVRCDGGGLRSDVRCGSGELPLRDGTFRSSGRRTSAGIFLPGRG